VTWIRFVLHLAQRRIINTWLDPYGLRRSSFKRQHIRINSLFVHVISRRQGRMQAGAMWCTCATLDFAFQFFAEHYSCTESDTETPSDSFLQSEVGLRQQVFVFHKDTRQTWYAPINVR